MRVLYAGDVMPADTTGPKVLYRHLRLLATHADVHIAHWERAAVPGAHAIELKARGWATRALASRRRRHFEAIDSIVGLRVRDGTLRQAIATVQPDVVLTIAQGGLCHTACRTALAAKIPLACFFHDWSPDWRYHPNWARRGLVATFRRLYARTTTAICISSAMREKLGPHAHAELLPPMPQPGVDVPAQPLPPPPGDAPLLYTGVLNGIYEPDLRHLIDHAIKQRANGPPLHLTGPTPFWGNDTNAALQGRHRYHGFVATGKFPSLLAGACALLVLMPFDEGSRGFATCNFPSKLTEYCAVGRPIVVWAPAYSSAVRWAESTGAAIAVTDPDPRVLFGAVDRLAADPAGARLVAARALDEYRTCFQPDVLQRRFESILETTVRNAKRA